MKRSRSSIRTPRHGGGTQQRSCPAVIECAADIQSGKYGKVQWVHCSRLGKREPIGKVTAPVPVPDHIDYELWAGPGPKTPVMREKFHYDWHWQWNWGTGETGNWGVHYIDDLPKDVSPLAVAAVMAQSFSEGNEGFKMLDKVRLIRLSNFDAGYIRFSIDGTLPSGENESAINQVYLVLRGKYVFEIAISTPLECDAATDADLEEMMESIFILKPFEV